MGTDRAQDVGEKVLRLVVQGSDRLVALACGKCGTVHPLGQEGRAAQCCEPYRCGTCGVETRRYWTICDGCRSAKEREKEAARFAAATVVPWDEAAGAMLYDEENDRWISEVEDAEDDDPPTRYAYATTPRLLHIDADGIIENALESGEHREDADLEVSDAMREELRTFLADWCRRTGVVSHFPDYSRVVVFTPALPAPAPRPPVTQSVQETP